MFVDMLIKFILDNQDSEFVKYFIMRNIYIFCLGGTAFITGVLPRSDWTIVCIIVLLIWNNIRGLGKV